MTSRIQLLELKRAWQPPDRLDRSRPREVRLTATGIVTLAIAAVLAAGAPAAGIGLGVLSGRQAEEARLMRQQSILVEGRVTRLWRSRENNRQPWLAYRIQFQGRNFEKSAKVGLSVWRQLTVGSWIPVYCVPSRPELNSPFVARRSVLPVWVPFLVAVALAAGAALACLPVRRQRRLLAEGRVAPAIVVSHGKRVRSSHGSDLGIGYSYQFPLMSGAIAMGKADPVKAPPAVGSTIPVLYDPENPRRNAPYPLAMVRLARRA